jgi:hypothetical protein
MSFRASCSSAIVTGGIFTACMPIRYVGIASPVKKLDAETDPHVAMNFPPTATGDHTKGKSCVYPMF